jgi:hypothetical protein
MMHMTSEYDSVDLGVLRTVWTSAMTPVDPILANNFFVNKKFKSGQKKIPFIIF